MSDPRQPCGDPGGGPPEDEAPDVQCAGCSEMFYEQELDEKGLCKDCQKKAEEA